MTQDNKNLFLPTENKGVFKVKSSQTSKFPNLKFSKKLSFPVHKLDRFTGILIQLRKNEIQGHYFGDFIVMKLASVL